MDINLDIIKRFRTSSDKEERKNLMEELIIQNEGLIWILIDKRNKRKINFHSREDAFQEGVLGLMQAAEKFDLSVKTKFATYAGYWIENKVNRFLYNDRVIHIPEGVLLKNNANVTEVDFGVSGEKIETSSSFTAPNDRTNLIVVFGMLKKALK
ncbi:MAG: sigma factor, partial [Cetobacterium sp.]